MSIAALVSRLASSREPLLGPSSREANRALLVTAVLVVLVSLRLAHPSQIPGIPADILASRAIVLVGLLGAQLIFLIMFGVNIVSDIQRVLMLESRNARDDAQRRYDHQLRLVQEELASQRIAAVRDASTKSTFEQKLASLRMVVTRIEQDIDALRFIGESGSRFSTFSAEMRIQMERLREAQVMIRAFESSGPVELSATPGPLERLASEFITRTQDALLLEAQITKNQAFSMARRIQTVCDILLGPIVTLLAWIIYAAI